LLPVAGSIQSDAKTFTCNNNNNDDDDDDDDECICKAQNK